MSNAALSDDSEILDESKPFSTMAIIALLLSIVGLLAIKFVPFTPIALAAIGIGILAKFLGRNNDYNGFSRVATLLSVAIGCLSVSAGTLSRTFANQSDLTRAQDVAELFFELVYKEDFDRLALLNNSAVPPEEFGKRRPTDQEQFEFRKRAMKANPVYQEIAALTEMPKWQFVRMDSEDSTPYYCSYRLVYRDANRTKSPLYKISVRRSQPKAGPSANPELRGRELTEEDLRVRWTVEFLEKMK